MYFSAAIHRALHVAAGDAVDFRESALPVFTDPLVGEPTGVRVVGDDLEALRAETDYRLTEPHEDEGEDPEPDDEDLRFGEGASEDDDRSERETHGTRDDEGEQTLTRLHTRTPGGRELSDHLRQVNEALRTLSDQTIESLSVRMRTVGHFTLTIQTDATTITLAGRPDTIDVESISVAN